MFRNITTQSHHAKSHLSKGFQPSRHDLLQVGSQSRRWFLQAGLSGLAGLSTADLLRLQARAGTPDSKNNRKSVILFWLSGGSLLPSVKRGGDKGAHWASINGSLHKN